MGEVIQFKKKPIEQIKAVTDKFLKGGQILNINIRKREIVDKDISKISSIIDTLYGILDGKDLKEKVQISFVDYENDSRELYQIPEIREFVHELLKDSFVLFYMLTKNCRIIFFLSCVSIDILEQNDEKIIVQGEIDDFMYIIIFAAAKSFSNNENEERQLAREMFKSVGYIGF